MLVPLFRSDARLDPPKPFAVTKEKSSKNDASASSAGSGKGWKMLNK